MKNIITINYLSKGMYKALVKHAKSMGFINETYKHDKYLKNGHIELNKRLRSITTNDKKVFSLNYEELTFREFIKMTEEDFFPPVKHLILTTKEAIEQLEGIHGMKVSILI